MKSVITLSNSLNAVMNHGYYKIKSVKICGVQAFVWLLIYYRSDNVIQIFPVIQNRFGPSQS